MDCATKFTSITSEMDLYKGYIINPTIEVTPHITVQPFDNSDLAGSSNDISPAREYLDKRFGNYVITPKARDAIKAVVESYHLKEDDVVTIFTTSQNFYISSCVTNAIEAASSKWSREMTDKTKLILINHEFGYPCKNMDMIKSYGLPIIEDCAQSIESHCEGSEIGEVGDFVIYSLSKYFPVQVGGIICSNNNSLSKLNIQEDSVIKDVVLSRLSPHIPNIKLISDKRLANFEYLSMKLRPLGIRPYFELEEGVIPGVFLFKWHDDIDYAHLKGFMNANGVESSVFYGKNAYFIPLHHKVDKRQMDYMIALLEYYLENRPSLMV